MGYLPHQTMISGSAIEIRVLKKPDMKKGFGIRGLFYQSFFRVLEGSLIHGRVIPHHSSSIHIVYHPDRGALKFKSAGNMKKEAGHE